jgi:hypothetical protein
VRDAIRRRTERRKELLTWTMIVALLTALLLGAYKLLF